MAKRALIIKGGTMRGAFLVGAMKTIHKSLGPNYFDDIYATSVGVYEQAFFAADQLNTMENTWREYIPGRQLINFWNIFKGKPILDLDYLIGLFQCDKSFLDVEKMKKSHSNLFAFITNYETKTPEVVDLKQSNVYDVLRATSAIPILYPTKVMINGQRYCDSWAAPQKVFAEKIREKIKDYDEVLAITAYPNDATLAFEGNIIRPTRQTIWGVLDTNRGRIIKTIEQGEKDTEDFLKNYKPSRIVI